MTEGKKKDREKRSRRAQIPNEQIQTKKKKKDLGFSNNPFAPHSSRILNLRDGGDEEKSFSNKEKDPMK